MKKISVVCARGIGDALLMHIVSHHLASGGYDVTTITPHRFGRWLENARFGDEIDSDTIFLQHDNSLKAKEIIAKNKRVYVFYGSHVLAKHGPLRMGADFVCDQNKTMVENVVHAIKSLFQIQATSMNGLKAPPGLVHRRHRKRVAIHTLSNDFNKNWPYQKFLKVAAWLKKKGYEPFFLPLFPSLEELLSAIYESGFFLGIDSGPGHIASCLHIPHLIIGESERHMRFWRPGWKAGEIVFPPAWAPKKYWKSFITSRKIIKRFKINVLSY